MKRVIVSSLFLIVAFVFGGSVQAKGFEGKVAYVDLSKVFDSYQKTKEYDAVLEKENTAFQEERNKMIEKVRDAQGKLVAYEVDIR